MLNVCARNLRCFRRDERGIILILFAVLIVPLMLIVGVVIDFGQSLVVKRQLTAAVDAAALSVSAEPQLDEAEARQKAQDYLKAHYPDAAIGRLKSFTANRDGDIIDVSATAELDTAFLRVAGYNTLVVTVNNRVVRKQSKLEVVMVLDNTGSMEGSKMAALKTAANELVDTLFGDDDEPAYVKIGLVPFTNTVNVGSNHRGAAWLDEATPAALNTEHVIADDGFASLFQIFDHWHLAWKGCVRSRAAPFDVTDATPDAADRRTLFTPYFAPDEMQGGSNNYFRNTNDPQYKTYSFYKSKPAPSASITSGPNYYCPNAIQDLTNVKSTITSAINAMVAAGPTVIPEGIAWGWRLISPGPPFTSGAPYTDRNTVKAVIVLTDGDNNVNPATNGAYKSIFSSYGFASNGHIGAPDGSQADDTLNEKTAQLCENIKADKDGDAADEDIIVYTIVFGVGVGSETETMMRDCASDPSKYFSSPTASDLQNAFESIALGLSKLRVAM